ncbi:hypothetical protein HK407_01g01960 [Ordospora pajunii]|uniref:uncharacterized protein n=1 Tax=Ordospora pajunii TaxID=3039483 RepID=UPI0029526BA1|nr:uncharacterized protein HK407_01g01960 [Ordospora pajunii]KAH9412301.1 hypothetical protein HK407_01g01960 [Ordospora pajunii]
MMKSKRAERPMDTVLVKLVDRMHPEIEHDALHVERSFTAEDIKRYLKAVLGMEGKYRLYIEGVPFEGSVDSRITDRGLEIEKGVAVEYEIDDQSTPDVCVDLEDTVMFLKVVGEDSKIWCCTYSGMLRMYSCVERAISLIATTECRGVRGMAIGDRMLAYDCGGKIVGVDDAKVLLEIVGDVTSMSFKGDMICIGTYQGECYVHGQELKKVNEFKTKVVFTSVSEEAVEFVSMDGDMYQWCLSGECKKTKLGHNVTAADMKGQTKVFGTSSSEMLVVSNNEKSVVKTRIRFSTAVAIGSQGIVAQASQYTISIINTASGDEMRKIVVDKCIAGIGWVENMLIVACGSTIRGYFIHY